MLGLQRKKKTDRKGGMRRMVGVLLALVLAVSPCQDAYASQPEEKEISAQAEKEAISAQPGEKTGAVQSENGTVPNEILVEYSDAGVSGKKSEEIQKDAGQELAKQDIEVTGEITEACAEQGTVVSAQIPSGMTVEEAVDQAMDAGEVAYAQPNYVYGLLEEEMQTLASVNDMYVRDETAYYLADTNVPEAWDIRKTEKSVTVAVLDTGCRMSHSDLKDNILKEYAYDAYYGKPLTASSEGGGDPGGHGTHVAGLVAAQANNGIGIAGTSYNAEILPVKIFDDKGDEATTESLLRGMQYIEELIAGNKIQNLHVINMSLGVYLADGSEDRMSAERIRRLKDSYDVICVCAGGNGDENRNPLTEYLWPSDLEECLSVVSHTKERRYSSWTDYNSCKDISAPGEGIISTYNQSDNSYAKMSGTSMAAPIVSGICALMWAAHPDLTVDRAMEAIKKTASPVEDQPAESGSAGAINAKAILDYLGIGRTDVSKLSVSLSKSVYTYNAKARKPKVTVRNGYAELGEEDYTVSYADNVKVGTAVVTITGKGDYYTGKTTLTFQIVPKGTKLSRIRKKKKGFQVYWKKQKVQTDGYEIQYASRKNFKKAHVKRIGKAKRTSVTVSGLKRGKTYYVRIRTFKKVAGKRYCSGWSGVKKVRL